MPPPGDFFITSSSERWCTIASVRSSTLPWISPSIILINYVIFNYYLGLISNPNEQQFFLVRPALNAFNSYWGRVQNLKLKSGLSRELDIAYWAESQSASGTKPSQRCAWPLHSFLASQLIFSFHDGLLSSFTEFLVTFQSSLLRCLCWHLVLSQWSLVGHLHPNNVMHLWAR